MFQIRTLNLDELLAKLFDLCALRTKGNKFPFWIVTVNVKNVTCFCHLMDERVRKTDEKKSETHTSVSLLYCC